MKTKPTHLATLTFVLGLSACAGAQSDDVCIADRLIAANQLAANLIAANRLITEELPEVALTSSSLADAIEPEALEDEFTRQVLEYMVSCALEPGQSVEIAVDGDVLVYEGSIGLAPQWGTEHGECDETCEGWVSACLIARTNFKGESVKISLLGDHDNLAPTAEESTMFDVEEATYFGDLFGETKSMYACVPAGSSGPLRTCGEHPESCTIAVLGECDAICDASGCRDPQGGLHAETITVNVRDASAACE